MSDNEPQKRDWIDICLKATTPLLVGIALALVGLYGERTMTAISNKQESARLITELQIKREQDESALRKDIFAQALEAFLLKGRATAEGDLRELSLREMSKQLLRLELLALNFGDSLSLSPLFTELRRDLNHAQPRDDEKRGFEERQEMLLRRLNSLAKRVASAQLSSLLQRGQEKSVRIPLNVYAEQLSEGLPCSVLLFKDQEYSWPQDLVLPQLGIPSEEYKNKGIADPALQAIYKDSFSQTARIEFQGVERFLEVYVKEVDHCNNSMTVQILVHRKDSGDPEVDPNFRLDFFNFPIVDNTRLQNNHRLAIVIEEFDLGEEPHIKLSAVVFPSEYASLRDRPGMEEARQLLESALQDHEPTAK